MRERGVSPPGRPNVESGVRSTTARQQAGLEVSTTRLFVYYKVPATDLAAVCQAARLMQQRLRAQHAGLQAELLRRPDAPQGVVTLMETYAAPQGVDEDLQANIQLAADDLARWPIGARHVELFIAP